MGALIVDYNGERLELSGMTDAMRAFKPHNSELVPGKDVHEAVSAEHFQRGTKVEFRYRELSDAGIPKEARFLRIKGDA